MGTNEYAPKYPLDSETKFQDSKSEEDIQESLGAKITREATTLAIRLQQNASAAELAELLASRLIGNG